jgi:hypothetical protein
MSASETCVSRLARRRVRPTRLLSTTNTGTIATVSAVRIGERISIATIVEPTTTALVTTVDAVLVIVVCTPPTSFANRDCTSPVRVAVKNASDMCSRCPNSRSRRSRSTRFPIQLV